MTDCLGQGTAFQGTVVTAVMALQIGVNDVATVPNDMFTNLRVSSPQGIRIASARAHECCLLNRKHEVAFTGRSKFQTSVLHVPRDFGSRIGDGARHLLKLGLFGRLPDG